MGGRASRQKGRRGEQQIATTLRETFPDLEAEIARGWQAAKGDMAPDVSLPNTWIECKTLARFNTSPLDQAIEASHGRGIPMAVIRVDRKKPVVMLRWDDFLPILKASGLVRQAVSNAASSGSPGQIFYSHTCDETCRHG